MTVVLALKIFIDACGRNGSTSLLSYTLQQQPSSRVEVEAESLQSPCCYVILVCKIV